MHVALTVGVNSWISKVNADAYFDAKYGASAWAGIPVDDQNRLLISAFNWIRQQSNLNIALTANSDIVKHAQAETAWFLYKHYEDFESHQAMQAMGVKSYRALDVSETFTDVVFPFFIVEMLRDFTTDSFSQFPRVHRDLADGGDEQT